MARAASRMPAPMPTPTPMPILAADDRPLEEDFEVVAAGDDVVVVLALEVLLGVLPVAELEGVLEELLVDLLLVVDVLEVLGRYRFTAGDCGRSAGRRAEWCSRRRPISLAGKWHRFR